MGDMQSKPKPILESAARLRELAEQFGEESEGGKNLDLCEEVEIYPTIFFDPELLVISRVRVYCDQLFLTDKDYTFIIVISEDEDNPGQPELIYENLLIRGPGCSEVGECEDVDPYDIQYILDVAEEAVRKAQNAK